MMNAPAPQSEYDVDASEELDMSASTYDQFGHGPMTGTEDLRSSKFNTIQRKEQLPAAAATMEKLCEYIEISIQRCAKIGDGYISTDIGNVMDGLATIGLYTEKKIFMASLMVESHVNATVTFTFTPAWTGGQAMGWVEEDLSWNKMCGKFTTINRIGLRVWLSFIKFVKVPWGKRLHKQPQLPLLQAPFQPASLAQAPLLPFMHAPFMHMPFMHAPFHPPQYAYPAPPAMITSTGRSVVLPSRNNIAQSVYDAADEEDEEDQPAPPSSSSGAQMMKNMAAMMAEMAKMLSQKTS
jgi:hypothetical protein